MKNDEDTKIGFESFLRTIGIDGDSPSFSVVMEVCLPTIEAAKRNLSPNPAWPQKSYEQIHKETGLNIDQYLEVYLGSLIRAGIATRKTIADHDTSAETAIDNRIRRYGPLPSSITPLRKSDLVDLELSTQTKNLSPRLRQARYRRRKAADLARK